MSKKDDFLRGGLNTLFNGGKKEEPQEQSEPQPRPEVEEATTSTEEEEEQENDVIDTIEDKRLKEALHARRMRGRGRPRKNDPKIQAAEGYQRITNIVNIEKMNKLREIALQEGLTIKEILEAVMDIAIERYESRHGAIKKRSVKAAELFAPDGKTKKK